MQFVCRLGTPDGRIAVELREAQDEDDLRADLKSQGFHVFDVRRRGLLAQLRLPSLGSKRISMQALLIHNQEMAALLRSGLPVLQTLELVEDRQRDPLFRKTLGEVRQRVRSGESLSDAVSGFGDLFPPLYAPTLKAGERSGDLETVIRRFIRYQRLMMEARKKIVTALVYPLVLVGLSIALIGVMTIYVVPKFSAFFSGLDTELPLLTRLTIGLSSFFSDNFLIIGVAVVLAILALAQWRRTPAGATTLDRWKLHLPLIGSIFHRTALSEFCRSLATLLSGGLPVVSALDVSVASVGNAHVRKKLGSLMGRVREGTALNAALDETGVVPDLAVDMVKVGEATGSLDAMLTSVSDFFDEEVETRMERLLSLIEPVMLVFMGGIVAILLVSIYLPLFGLMGQVQY
jgi:type IV pilus assembly protein PilC